MYVLFISIYYTKYQKYREIYFFTCTVYNLQNIYIQSKIYVIVNILNRTMYVVHSINVEIDRQNVS